MNVFNPSEVNVVIFAGGEGTRLSEVTESIPKPLVPVNGEPIILHIMRGFYSQGFKNFILAVGYKSEKFKQFFRDYTFYKKNVYITNNDFFVDDKGETEDWSVTIVETGEKTPTGERLRRLRPYLDDTAPFVLTYGDSVSDVRMSDVWGSHSSSDEHILTVTAVSKDERFGIIKGANGHVDSFSEKSQADQELINGGFMIVEPTIFDFIPEDAGDFSHTVMTDVANKGKMGFYHHTGFWKPCDTKRDLDLLNSLHKEKPELFGYVPKV